jgi:hypothetical protein
MRMHGKTCLSLNAAMFLWLWQAPLPAAEIRVYPDSVLRAIPEHLYGAGDELDENFSQPGVESLVARTGPTLLRLGGISTEYYDWEAHDYAGVWHIDFVDTHRIPEPLIFGIDSLLRWCERLHAEPVLTVNFQINDPGKAARLVEYCNGDTNTIMGNIRAQRGHPDPYNVTYWCVGNEVEIGGTKYQVAQYTWTFYRHFGIPFDQWSWRDSSYATPPTYAALFSAYSDSMRTRSPLPLKIGTCLAADASWIEPVIGTQHQKLDWLDIHYYPSWCDGFDSNYTTWLAAPDRATLPWNYPPVADWYPSICAQVAAHSHGKDIPVYVFEYNSGAAVASNDDYWWGYLDGLFIADVIGHFAAAGVPKAALYSLYEGKPGQTDYPIFGMIRGDTLSLRSPAHVLKMYRELFGDTLVRATSDAVDSGNGLEVYGSRTGDTVAVIVINKNLDSAYQVTLTLAGFSSNNLMQVWDITNDTILRAPFNGTKGIVFRGDQVGNGSSVFTHTFPKASVTMLRFAPKKQNLINQQVATNGSFEMPVIDPTRPPYWYVGWSDSPPACADSGRWSLNTVQQVSGQKSLCLEPVAASGFFVSQILDVPCYDLKGKTITAAISMQYQGTGNPPGIILFALCPGKSFAQLMQDGLVLAADTAGWKRYQGQFIVQDNAIALAVMLLTTDTAGRAWFDSLAVNVDVIPPGPAPAPVTAPIAVRRFKTGATPNAPANYSERAYAECIDSIAAANEVLNVFFHVKWCALTGADVAWSHRRELDGVRLGKQRGLDIVLTMDFTHTSAESVGHINPLPNGTPVGTLNDPQVVRAYEQELFALCSLAAPQYVMVGIEVDIFHDKHPQEWNAYVTMFKEISDTLTRRYPGIHVTAYFTLTWLVNPDGSINNAHRNDWRMLLPQLPSMAFSMYPGTFGTNPDDLAPGYFTRAREVAPELPILIPEFGVPGGTDAALSEDRQAQILSRIFTELETTKTELACWYAMYDQTYLGAPDWFVNAFNRLGVLTQDRTPKKTWAVWNAVHQLPRTGITGSRPPRHEENTVISNYPDPFNHATSIRYELAQPARVSIAVFDLEGNPVKELLPYAAQTTGTHRIQWAGTDDSGNKVPSGSYVCLVKYGNNVVIKKMMVAR